MNSHHVVAQWMAEFVGTALLVGVGCTWVVLDLKTGGTVSRWIPSEGARRALTGFLFGSTGCLITLSPIGKISGAHINPAVTLGFWIRRRIESTTAIGYIIAQVAGGIVGAWGLGIWGSSTKQMQYAATVPGRGGDWVAALGEVGATFLLVVLLFSFLGHVRLRNFVPYLLPVLYAILVWIEAPISGTSTNPARSVGPELMTGMWNGWWVYWLGPLVGAMLAVSVLHVARPITKWEIQVAKMYHFYG